MTLTATPPCFHTPYGSFQLTRHAARSDEGLLAWASADTLLLEETYRRDIPGSRIVVVNDAHGALCVALQPELLWTDSALAVLALRHNERANLRPETPVLWSRQTPDSRPDCVVMRIPKLLTYFEYQLAQIARLLPTGATVLAAGMDKHLSPHTASILEQYIGPTQRVPGRRKARMFSAVRDDKAAPGFSEIATYFCPQLGAELHSLPNVFSREKLDIGTRFLLEHIQRLKPAGTVMDLACGNGVLGLAAITQGLASKLVFCDESAMAIASAQLNTARLIPDAAHNVSFHHDDGISNYYGEKAQLILCNPPFHQEHTVNEFAGRRLLDQCHQHLLPGGRLLLVANRHLDYPAQLRSRFSRVEKLACNSKFNILLAFRD